MTCRFIRRKQDLIITDWRRWWKDVSSGVRPYLMFASRCLSYKLASPTLADVTLAKKALRYYKGTRELNLYLTTPALKPNDLNKTLKHVTGYSDADWAGDPGDEEKHILYSVLRWSISPDKRMSGTGNCCLVLRRIRIVCSRCIVSWVDIRTSYPERDWTIIPDTRESRQQHSTRGGNETRSESQDETHSHEILIRSRFGIPETADDVISQDWCEPERHRDESAGTWAIPQIEINA